MKKLSFTLLVALLAALSVPCRASQQPQSNDPRLINPLDYHVVVTSDERLLIMMAALIVAGFDDAQGTAAPLRAQLRDELKSTPADLVERLRAYYQSHRLPAREEAAQISPYIGLALTLSAAPELATPPVLERLPGDVRSVVEFASLVKEFYSRSPIRNLMPKYKTTLEPLKAQYERTASLVLYDTINYLHTQPVLFLPPTPGFTPEEIDPQVAAPRNRQDKDDRDEKRLDKAARDKQKQEEKERKAKQLDLLSRPRVRRLLIFLNPFAPAGSVFQRNDILNAVDTDVPRRLGDDYCIVASEQSLTEHIRYGFLRFVLDPIVGKSSVEIANLKEKIDPLIAALPTARERARRNVYEAVGESLARAVSVRLSALITGASFTNDDAIFLLSQHYEQGAVLVFHFYNGLKDLERVGVDVKDFVAPYLNNIDFAREAKRLEEARAARARVEARRASVKPIFDVDLLIKERKYAQARAQLEAILKDQPNNARALFGMAQVVNNEPTSVELEASSSDDDKIAAQEERLARAVKLYREAIAAAAADERWLVSQCHVFIGRIYDFVEQREAALAEYDKAIKLGDIDKGAYKEAQRRKEGLNHKDTEK